MNASAASKRGGGGRDSSSKRVACGRHNGDIDAVAHSFTALAVGRQAATEEIAAAATETTIAAAVAATATETTIAAAAAAAAAKATSSAFLARKFPVRTAQEALAEMMAEKKAAEAALVLAHKLFCARKWLELDALKANTGFPAKKLCRKVLLNPFADRADPSAFLWLARNQVPSAYIIKRAGDLLSKLSADAVRTIVGEQPADSLNTLVVRMVCTRL